MAITAHPDTGPLDAPEPSLSLLVVDDDSFNREGLRTYLEPHGFSVREAGDEAGAWALIEADPPQAAIIDISIPPDASQRVRPSHSFGLSLAKRLKQAHPATGLVIFSAYEDRGDDVWAMVKSGARSLGYKLKGCPPADLLATLREVLSGRVVIDPEVTGRRSLAGQLAETFSADERDYIDYAVREWPSLTQRENDVAYRLAASQNIKGIAEALHLSPKSVENYVTNVYGKLGLNLLPGHLREIVILAKACMVRDLSAGPAKH